MNLDPRGDVGQAGPGLFSVAWWKSAIAAVFTPHTDSVGTAVPPVAVATTAVAGTTGTSTPCVTAGAALPPLTTCTLAGPAASFTVLRLDAVAVADTPTSLGSATGASAPGTATPGTSSGSASAPSAPGTSTPPTAGGTRP